MTDRRDDRRRLGWALLLTLSIMVAEIAGGLLSGSLALLSDAGHMLTDSVTLVLSFAALRLSQAPRDDKYTFGWKRIEILAALLNGILLLAICGYIGYEGVHRLLRPAGIRVPVMLSVASVGLAANLICVLLLRHSTNLNIRSAFLHILGDLLSSVGVVLGGVAMLVWNIPWIDPLLSIAIAAMVLIGGYRLIREAAGVLMEAAPEGVDVGALRDSMHQLSYVTDVHDLHVWTITSGMLSMSCHVVVEHLPPKSSDAILREINSIIERRFGITHTTIQIESPAFSPIESPCGDCD